MNSKGKLVIFSAPSGSGKSTIINSIINKGFNLEFSISATTRPIRGTEINGKDYYFLTVNDFKQRIDNQEFIEWEEVYKNKFYGTLHSETSRIWAKGNNVIFDVDVKGGINLKKIFGNQAVSIFIQPPSTQVLRERLLKRGTDTLEAINERVAKATEETAFASQFDYIVINDVLDSAIKKVEEILTNFLL